MISLFVSLFLLFQPISPDTTSVESDIESATVFLSGAEVHRSATIRLKTGTNYLTFPGLSTSLNEETIQLRTNSEVVLESIAKSINPDRQGINDDQIKQLESRKEQIEDSIKHKEAAITVLNKRLNFLATNQDLSGDNTKITAAEIRQGMDYFSRQFEEIENHQIQIKAELAALREQLNEVNRKLGEIRTNVLRASGMIELAVYSESQRDVAFNLSYFVPGARWQPSYDVRVKNTDQPLDLSYKANIQQNTGVDWNNVELTISSAEPRSDTSIPTINPVYLEFYEPDRTINLDSKLSLKETSQDKIMIRGNSSLPSPVKTNLQQGQTAFSFEIKNPYTITSGVEEKIVAVESHTIPASYNYFAIPKKRETALLTAKITGWNSLNLLSGSANLFLEDSFVGKTAINPSAVVDTLTFSLGEDKGINIERSQIEAFKEKNFFGNKITETKGWEISIRNAKSSTIKINILDQIPVTSNEDIDVELTERSGAAFNKSTGELTWKIDLDAGESQTLQFIYKVTYPDNKQLQQPRN